MCDLEFRIQDWRFKFEKLLIILNPESWILQRVVANDRAETGDKDGAENRQRFENAVLSELRAAERFSGVEKRQTDRRQRRRQTETEHERQH